MLLEKDFDDDDEAPFKVRIASQLEGGKASIALGYVTEVGRDKYFEDFSIDNAKSMIEKFDGLFLSNAGGES